MAKTKKKKKRARKKNIFITILVILAAILFAFNIWYNNFNSLVPERGNLPEDMVFSQDRINLLFVGADDNNEEMPDGGRADAIIVASINFKEPALFLLSIPRDTLVEIEGYGKDKINHSFSQGGIELTKSTVENLLHIPIDYYAFTNFAGFKDIVDILGGVEIEVDKRMYYRTYDGMIDIEKGLQRLDGEKALQYVRYRHDALGDITRVERQQNFLIALAAEALAPENFTKLPEVASKLMDSLDTDLSAGQVIKLSKLLKSMNSSMMESATLPGDFSSIKGISYWVPNTDNIDQLVLQHFSDTQDTDENGENTGENSEETLPEE